MPRRVAITGAGAITPMGATLDATRAGVRAGRTAIGPCRAFDTSGFRQHHAAEVPDFDPRAHFRHTKALKLTDRTTRLAVGAAAMALESARWPAGTGDRLGVLIGTSGFDLHPAKIAAAAFPDPVRAADDIPFFAERVLTGLTPLWLLMMLPNMTSSHVAIQLAASGPNSTIMSHAAAGLQAIGEAADWIRAGECDAVLAGGADCAVTPAGYAALQQAGVFDAADAPPPAEGAAVLLLEDEAHARRRGAIVYGTVEGYATTTGPCALSRALAGALRESGWSAADLDCLCAAGVDGLAGLPRSVRRLSLDGAMGDLIAAAGPTTAALALDGASGHRLLCATSSDVGPSAAVAIHAGDLNDDV